MFRIVIVIIVTLLLLLPWDAHSQQGKYIIQNYNLTEELSINGSVWTGVQAANGTMFFGYDNGIVLYDGSGWSQVSHNHDVVRSLEKGHDNTIYYGALNDFGIIAHNISDGYFLESLCAALPDSINGFGEIWSICEMEGTVFFQTSEMVFILKDGKLDFNPVGDSYHRGFVSDGRYYLNQKGIGLTVYDGTAFSLVKGGEIFHDKIVSAAITFPDGKLWVGTRMDGLYTYDAEDSLFVAAFPEGNDADNYIKRNNLYHAVALPASNIALATLYGGTIIINQNGEVKRVLNRSHGINDNVHYYLHYSADNNLWMCTSNGIATWNFHSPFVFWDYTTGIDGIVLDIIKFRESVLVGSLTGLYSISDAPNDYSAPVQQVSQLMDSEVWKLTAVSPGRKEMILIGTGKGLYSYNGSYLKQISKDGVVLNILYPDDSHKTVLSFRDDAIDVYVWNGDTYVLKNTFSGLFSELRTAAIDNNGFLWIGTRNLEVIKVPVADIINSTFNKDQTAVYRFEDQLTDVISYEGMVLFSNNEGLHFYNYEDGNFSKCSLFGPSIAREEKMFTSLEKDSFDNIWVGGNEIFLYHPDGSYTIEKLHFHQIEEVFSAFVFYHDNEKTWIGGNSGVYLLQQKPAFANINNFNTLINKVSLPQDSLQFFINVGKREESLNEDCEFDDDLIHVDLNSDNSQIVFYFSLPYYNSENRTQYSYRLNNFNDTWSGWAENNYAIFSNLSPGDYCFEVRAMSINNEISPSARISFHVDTPWYISVWAIILYIAVGVTIIYIISMAAIRSRVRKQFRIEEVIQRRIQENKINKIVDSVKKPAPVISDEPFSGSVERTPFEPLVHQKGQDQIIFLSHALEIIEDNLGNPDFNVEQFCEAMEMNQTQTYRKMISVTGMSITGFIRNTRLKKAAQMLLEKDLSISEVAYQTGFNSPSYFTRCFKGEFGCSPREFVQRQKTPE